MTTTTDHEVIVLGRDHIGTIAEGDGMRYYLTECCGASAKGCDGYVGCRACHQPIDDALGGLPRQPEGSAYSGFGGPLVEVYGDGITYDEWKVRYMR